MSRVDQKCTERRDGYYFEGSESARRLGLSNAGFQHAKAICFYLNGQQKYCYFVVVHSNVTCDDINSGNGTSDSRHSCWFSYASPSNINIRRLCNGSYHGCTVTSFRDVRNVSMYNATCSGAGKAELADMKLIIELRDFQVPMNISVDISNFIQLPPTPVPFKPTTIEVSNNNNNNNNNNNATTLQRQQQIRTCLAHYIAARSTSTF